VEEQLVEYSLEKFLALQTSLNPSLARREETSGIPLLTKERLGEVALI